MRASVWMWDGIETCSQCAKGQMMREEREEEWWMQADVDNEGAKRKQLNRDKNRRRDTKASFKALTIRTQTHSRFLSFSWGGEKVSSHTS